MDCRSMLPAVVLCGFVAGAVRAEAQALPAATGRVIEAAAGDVVVVPRDARVTVIVRSQVQARLVYVAAQRTVLLLTDPAVLFGDGQPDAKGFFRWQVEEPWPLEPRWEGPATIDEYQRSTHGPSSLAIHTDRGTVVIGPPHVAVPTLTPAPIAVLRSVGASSRAARGSFDEIEQAWLSGGEAGLPGPPAPRAAVRMQGVRPQPPAAATSGAATPAGAVRVGGPIAVPRKVQSANPIYPQTAQEARVQGVVVLEIQIGTDGTVADARVLRSIPLLDQAALDAVRQWRYEPTLLNGAPVPVIMTVTVNFALQTDGR